MATAGRMEAARAELLEMVAEASDEKLVSIVEAGPQARVLTAFSREPSTLTGVVEELAAGGGTADLEGAIRLARGLATPDRPTTMLLLSDGAVEGAVTEPVSDGRHLLFDAVDDNLAITGFGPGDAGEGVARVFVEVTSFSGSPATAPVAITVDGLEVGTVDFDLGPGESGRQLFPIDAGPGQVVEARLLTGPDGNPLDDTASLVLTGGTQLAVATTGEVSPFLDALLAAMPGVARPQGTEPDLVVMDGGDGSTIDRPTWMIRPEVPPDGVDVVGRFDNPVITFTQPGDPLIDGLDFSTVTVAEADIVQAEGLGADRLRRRRAPDPARRGRRPPRRLLHLRPGAFEPAGSGDLPGARRAHHRLAGGEPARCRGVGRRRDTDPGGATRRRHRGGDDTRRRDGRARCLGAGVRTHGTARHLSGRLRRRRWRAGRRSAGNPPLRRRRVGGFAAGHRRGRTG